MKNLSADLSPAWIHRGILLTSWRKIFPFTEFQLFAAQLEVHDLNFVLEPL